MSLDIRSRGPRSLCAVAQRGNGAELSGRPDLGTRGCNSRPSGLGADNILDDLRDGGLNVTGSDNNCGMTDNVSASIQYQGTTTAGVQITSDGKCKARDGTNVVGFGNLPSQYLGFTCTWTNGAETEVKESDMRLNKVEYSWTYSGASFSCSNRWVIEAVTTHERLHTFGIRHVDESSHANLSASSHINGPCQNSESTLGRGDVLGLRTKY